MSKRSKPAIIVKKGNDGGISPVSAYDAEQLDAMPAGTEFDLVSRTKRSNPQNRLYWKLLSEMIAATSLSDAFPRSHDLHEALLKDLGYVITRHWIDSKDTVEPDSTAFEAMDPEDFRVYFDKAMMLLSELTGIDPLTIARRGK